MNRNYMQSAEFKTKQLWLNFNDAVGIALQILEEGKRQAWQWFKTWSKKNMKCKFDNKTMELDFNKTDDRNIIDLEALNYFGVGSNWCVLSRNKNEMHCKKTKREKFPAIFKFAAPQ